MIHSKGALLWRVALSVALLAGVASVGLFSSPAHASTPQTTTTKKTTFTLNCNTGIANGTVTVTTTQTYPVSVAHGTTFKIKWKSVTQVGGALASAAYAIAPGGKEVGTIVLDNDSSTDATPSPLNIAGTGLPEQGTISSPSGFPVYTPVQGTTPKKFATPSFTAGTAGTDTVTAGADNANIKIYNSSGTLVTTTTADCTPSGTPATIATISVT